MTQTMTRHNARKLRLAAQATGGAILTGAILLAIMVPRSAPAIAQSIEQTSLNSGPAGNSGPGGQDFLFDPEAIGFRMAMLDNAPKPKEVEIEEPPPPPDKTGTGTPAPRSLTDRIKFLGTMSVGEKKMALITIDGHRQRVVAEGLRLPIEDEQVFLQQATNEKILVTSGGATLTILLAEADEKPAFSTLNDTSATASSMIPQVQSYEDRGGRGGRRGRDGRIDGQDTLIDVGASAVDPIEKRRIALQRAVENGSITQQRADEMMDRAMKTQLNNDRNGNNLPSTRRREN